MQIREVAAHRRKSANTTDARFDAAGDSFRPSPRTCLAAYRAPSERARYGLGLEIRPTKIDMVAAPNAPASVHAIP